MKKVVFFAGLLGLVLSLLLGSTVQAKGNSVSIASNLSGAATVLEQSFILHAAVVQCAVGQTPPQEVSACLGKLIKCSASIDDLYERATVAKVKAEWARIYAGSDVEFSKQLADSAQADVAEVVGWLEHYGQFVSVHGFEEPMWINGRPEVVAQTILALTSLEQTGSQSTRRQNIARFAEGLSRLLRGAYSKYPFGAHMSYKTTAGRPRTYLVPGSNAKVAGASLIAEQNYTVCALVAAAKLLGQNELLESAQREGLGLLAHLAVAGNTPYCFAPRPERERLSPQAAAVLAENLISLHHGGSRSLFGSLAGCAAIDVHTLAAQVGDSAVTRASELYVDELLTKHQLNDWLGARDIRTPFNGQVVELEAGKAVQKAFDVYPIAYPGGTPGKLAVVGRDNMFWMRFDVDREDNYFFYLCFLKSDVSGGLVSVMMRIDGDKIFQVNLGGASDDPYVDVELVAGPRPLRQGPHSFGIRFSGLLMKNPAVLDAIMVEPAVQRRWVSLADGRRLLVLNSIAEESVRVRMQELEGLDASGLSWNMVQGLGSKFTPKLSHDKRSRLWMDMPAGGVGTMDLPASAVVKE